MNGIPANVTLTGALDVEQCRLSVHRAKLTFLSCQSLEECLETCLSVLILILSVKKSRGGGGAKSRHESTQRAGSPSGNLNPALFAGSVDQMAYQRSELPLCTSDRLKARFPLALFTCLTSLSLADPSLESTPETKSPTGTPGDPLSHFPLHVTRSCAV